MTTEQKISIIIEDCCAADPSLHGREAELRPIVRALLEAQPDTKFDKNFAARLRKQVLAKAKSTPSGAKTFFDRLKNLNRNDVFVLGGAALGLVLAVTLATTAAIGNKGVKRVELAHVTPQPSMPAGTSAGITSLSDGAFGDLRGASPQQLDAGRGGTMGLASNAVPAPSDPASAIAPDKLTIMPAPTPVNYRFVYSGEIALPGEKVQVYRRVKGFSGGSPASLFPMVQNVVDLTRLQDPKIQNFSLIDDREFGYNVYVEALEGAVSFSQYWPKWPHPENTCRDEACFEQYRLKPGDMPANDAIVGAAEAFLSDYGIARDAFGAPEVRDDWRQQLAAADGAVDRIYVPENVSVVYPTKIGGMTVDEGNGVSTGMSVTVNVRHMRADGAWGITSNAYESSAYPAETDMDRLRTFIEKGGVWGFWQNPEAETVDVVLGEPATVLVRIWKTRDDGMGEELFVPALRFPIVKPPTDGSLWGRTAVLVPLAKDMLEEGPVGRPMPLMAPDMVR